MQTLSAEEKAALVAGADFMDTNALPRAGVPSLHMADGPHGLRKTKTGQGGYADSEPATAFPTASTLAAGWDVSLVRAAGEAIARECRRLGVGLLLGPAVNIQRDPRCGRNFEYYSEDPLLAGESGAAFVRGVQSQGVGACVKHFALNNSENFRFLSDSVADERTLRELYLRPFERIVRSASPAAVMCAYNKVNGVHCSENARLLQDILRGEWGFGGVVLSDWGAVRDRAASLRAGLDLEMPGDTAVCRRVVLDGGQALAPALDAACERILRLVRAYASPPFCEVDFDAQHALAADIAAQCAVLLKNEGALPLCGGRLLIAGELFRKMRYQGAGSSLIRPARLTTPQAAFDARGVPYDYVCGYRLGEDGADAALIAEAAQAAERADAVLVFAGLDDFAESEASDRAHMRLAAGQCALIDALAAAGKPVTVVLFGGSPVELPFWDKISALLYMGLPGQNGGEAAARLLLGECDPCGRLAQTWPLCAEDVPQGAPFGKTPRELYKEGVFAGYRYYTSAHRAVRFPFGFGRTYTTFEARLCTLECRDGRVRAVCAVTNTGARDGAEVLQLYVRAPRSAFAKPVRELRAFAKVFVPKGQTREAELCFSVSDLRAFDPACGAWVTEGGEYEAQLCSDAQTVLCRAPFSLPGVAPSAYSAPFSCDDEAFARACGAAPLPKRRPVTLETRVGDLGVTLWGKLVRRILLSAAGRQAGGGKGAAGTDRANRAKRVLFLRRTMETITLRGLTMNGGGRCPYNVAEGLMHLCNGHPLRALGAFMRKIRVPALPKDAKNGKTLREKRPE